MKKIYNILSILFVTLAMASCSQDMDIESNEGYLYLEINSLVSTHEGGSRAAAPDDYAPKTLHVELLDETSTVLMSTDDYANDPAFQGNIKLKVGVYKIIAHSANWDGSGSGFDTPYYYGTSDVQVKAGTRVKGTVVCTQANVKITVNYDEMFVANFKSAVSTVTSSVDGVSPLQFVMNETAKSGYIPVGNFDIKLDVTNNADVSFSLNRKIEDVKAREHYIFNYKLAQEGHLGNGTNGGIQVEVDESTNTYTFTMDVPRKPSISLVTRAANAWSTFAMLNTAVTAKTNNFNAEGLSILWKKASDAAWTTVAYSDLAIDSEDNVTATVRGLEPGTAYEYRLCYKNGDDEILADPVQFTTEKQITLYNGGFENWYNSGKIAYPNEMGVTFWDTSNPGGASFGGSNTTETTAVVHSGSKAAMLVSQYIVIKFAAASLYTGKFGALVGTSGAWLNWGVPFTSRPTALKGYMQYAPKAINRPGTNLPAGAPREGEMDQCGMYCALLSESLVVDNTKMNEFPNFETDSRVIAYGSLPAEQNVHSNNQWKEVNIPLVYRTLTKKPTHLLIVFSASKYGDYFHGGEGSTLYLDDFSLEYGDTPAVQ